MAGRTVSNDESISSKIRAVASAPIGIVIADAREPDNPLIYVNAAFETLTGYSKEQILGKNCRILQGPETDPATIATIREGIQSEQTVTTVIRNYRADGAPFWNEVTIAPLRNEVGTVTHFVGFQVDVTERMSAQQEVARRADQLERLLSRIQGLIQDVTELLMRSVSREETESEICQRIIESNPYTLAAFGERQPGSNNIEVTTIHAAASSDIDEERLLADDHPAIENAIRTKSVQLCSDGPTHAVFGEQCATIAIAPLVYGSQQYGVLIVGTEDDDAFDEREKAVVDSLGRTIAIAINATESRRILAADNVVELEFVTTDRDLVFVDIAMRCGCSLEYEGAVPGTGGTVSMFFTTSASIAELQSAIATSDSLAVRLISEDAERRLVAFDVRNNELIRQLVERGGELKGLRADPEETRIIVEALKPANPRSIIEWITATYSETEMIAFRERDRPPMTKTDFIGELEDRLTDRQQTAIQIAYTSGYYDSNRSVTGDELADIMGITRATFHQHLRAAERKVIGEFFEH